MKKKSFLKSQTAFSQACKYIPGGVNSPVRAFGGVNEGPVFIEKGKGSKIYDIDGSEFIDYVCSWGPLILGHCRGEVIEAVAKAAEKGTSFGAPTLAETELAERVVGAFKSIEKVRLVSSGTEAVMSAVRLARGYTGRDVIIKMAGCYHGHSDFLLVSAGSGLAEGGKPSSAGVPIAATAMTCVVPYNDFEAVKKAFETHRGKIAACLVEPVAANMGVIVPQAGYLQLLRQLCDEEKAVLIFDEVISGFRVAYGGAAQLYGVDADLTCLGKIVGGGLPAAAFGGRAEIMDMLAPLGGVYQAGTLSGNPLATAAANATLKILSDKRCYEQLETKGARLEEGFAAAAKEHGIPLTINRVGSVMSCFFTDKQVRNFDEAAGSDIGKFKKFFSAMLHRGIYLAPSAFEAMFISLAHSDEDIQTTISAAEIAFAEI